MPAEVDCPFEKPILSGQCACTHAERASVGEQMRIGCRSALACANCRTTLAFLRERCRFVLKIADLQAPIPFGKEMRLMIGGLLGLQRLLQDDSQDEAHVSDIHALINRAKARYGALAQLPYEAIVRSISAYQPRRRSRPG